MRPLFLISNDDGLHCSGIHYLINLLCKIGDVLVVVPETDCSGKSTSFTSKRPLYLTLVSEDPGIRIYTSNGTPVDCVKQALNLLTDRKPDMLVAGINHGFNASVAVHYSGTMGAVVEGCISGIMSVGFSLDDHSADADFKPALPYLERIVHLVLDHGLPDGVFLNVNIPCSVSLRGIKVCRQGRGRWREEFDSCHHPKRNDLYWLTGTFRDLETGEKDYDQAVMKEGYIAVVPSQIDMTSYMFLEKMKTWDLGIVK